MTPRKKKLTAKSRASARSAPKKISEKAAQTAASRKDTRSEIYSVLLLLAGAFIWITATYPATTGVIGEWVVGKGLTTAVGNGIPWLPPVLTISAIGMLLTQDRNYKRLVAASLGCAYGALVIILGIETQEGGLIGNAAAQALLWMLGKSGAWLVVIGCFLISAVLLIRVSIGELMKKGARKTQKQVSPWLQRLKYGLFYRKVPAPLIIDILPPEQDLFTPLLTRETEAAQAVVEPFIAPMMQADPPMEEPPAKPSAKKRESKKILVRPYSKFQLPDPSLLEAAKAVTWNTKAYQQKQQEQAKMLEEALASFHVGAKVVNVTAGPSVTRFELQPGAGVKISKITNLSKDIALKLAAPDIRIEAPIPGKALVGIEVPNSNSNSINLRFLMGRSEFDTDPSKLLCGMGLTITGEAILMDLAKMPHVLIAGATGSGKSVCINAIILSILMRATPDEVKFLMIDPKKVELSLYEGIPHLLAPVVTNPQIAAATLKKWALQEMEKRYEIFSRLGVKHIDGYNEKVAEMKMEGMDRLPYVVVVIDELADLMMVASQEVETTICRLAQMARATGIHLVIATQRPSVNVVTGLIKANVPSRISFFLQSQIDSRTILDMPGAEKLLGKGDMLYAPVGSFKPKRVQGIYVSEAEVKRVVEFLKTQGQPDYVNELLEVEPLTGDSSGSGPGDDELFAEAVDLVKATQQASTSFLQRKLRIGYNRAARLIDELEAKGIISRYNPDSKSRTVL